MKKKMELTSSSSSSSIRRKLRSDHVNTMPVLRKVKSDGATSTSTSTSTSVPKLRKAKSQPEKVNQSVPTIVTENGNAEMDDCRSAVNENENENEVEVEVEVVCEDKAIIDHKRPEFPCSEIDEPNSQRELDEDETLDEQNDQESWDHIQEQEQEQEHEPKPEPEPEPREDANEQPLPIQKPKPIASKSKGADVAAASNVIPPSPTSKQKIPSPSKSPACTPSSTVHHNYAKLGSSMETHSRLHSLVDLVMWRDVSRSAFVFGIGAFTIISSSYTKDVNISFITVVSYLGLVYLAATFLYRSIFCRDYVDIERSEVVGEEEALWLLKLLLPYLNEFLWKLKALFSGDPATTMKLAVLLFVMARCGSSITIWKLAKLGFFGVFTVPKVCSSYSTHISAFGKFWIRRFRDAWEGCSHKKAVAFAIFALIWNLSSVVARFWAAFMMLVAFKYYHQQQSQQSESESEAMWQKRANGPRRRASGPTISEPGKPKQRKTS